MKKTVLLCLLFIGLASAQEQMHTLNLQDADIRLLVETVSDITGKNFVIDPQVEAQITVISSQPIPEAEIYDLFLSVLSVNGYTTETQGNTIKILPLDKSTALKGSEGSHPDAQVTRIFRIRHIGVNEVEQMLKGIAGSRAKIISNQDNNLLIVSDTLSNVNKMRGIVDNLDRESEATIDLIPLTNANAQDVATTLESLLDSGNNLGPKTRIVADNRTNSIIVNANPALKNRIMSIVQELDKPLETNTESQVIYLKYAQASKLVPILETLANKNQKEGEAVLTSIQAHEETNSLIINAPPSVYRNLTSAIGKLDIKRRQVLIEAIIAEVSLDNSRDLGVDWYAPLAGDNNDGLVGGSFTGERQPNLQSDDPLDVFGSLISGGLNLGYINYDTDADGNRIFRFGGLLRALATNVDNNIVSTPSVVTLNHQEAKLSVGQEVPFLTGQFTNTGNSDSSGSPNPFSTIQREDVGLSLTVTPHINEGDQIVLDISQELSSLDNTSTAVDLITNKRTLTTSVIVPDNTVLVLGGLIDDSIEETIRKVPVLGDIPLVRNLFRTKKRARVKRNLMIFIHPQIIRDRLMQERITTERYNDIREQQKRKVSGDKFRKGNVELPAIGPEQPPEETEER